MVSIGKLAVGQEGYYLEQAQGRVDRATSVGSGVEDYYVQGTEASGYWLGLGSEHLQIVGEVDREALTRALQGHDPLSARELVAPHVRRVPGFDVTFSAPKSVSVLFGLGDESLRRTIRSAHDAAVAEAFAYLERVAANGRRGAGGSISIKGSGFIAAAFRHRTSRAGDPQLHTHVLIANLVQGVDGRWSALDGRAIFQHAKTAGYLYEARLRARMSERLGVEWTPVRNGIADVEGVPTDVLRGFSRRRAEIEAELLRRGESSAAAARMATLSTRQRKDYGVVPEQLVELWRERAAQLGFDRAALRAVLGRRSHQPDSPVEWDRAFTRLAAPTGLTQRRSTFAPRDVVQALCEAVPPGSHVSVREFEAMAEEFLESEVAVRVLDGDAGQAAPSIRLRDGRMVFARTDRRFSTVELLSVERQVIETALAGVGGAAGIARPEALKSALAARPFLSGEQVTMVQRLVGDGDRVAIVVGPAGTGKTVALAAARDAWEASGISVQGVAVARRAARELSDGAGIQSTSVTALLRRLRLGADPLPRGSVLVIDEAGMLATRQLAELLRHTTAVGAKLVLTGDHRQLPELEAGGCFRGLAIRLPYIGLKDNRRQHAPWEQEALRELRHGDVEKALAEYKRQERIVVAPDAHRLGERLVADWWSSGGPNGGIMIALRRTDVRTLNRLARIAMRDAGRLHGEELFCGEESISAGDVVVLRLNDPRRGVTNGDRGTVVAVGHGSLQVDVGGRVVELDDEYLSRFTNHGDPVVAHGYAVTGHVAQGLTTDRAFVLASDELYREWAYTAMSRGRATNRLYMVGDALRIRDEIAPRVRSAPEADLLGTLRQSRRQQMALDVERDGQVPVGEPKDRESTKPDRTRRWRRSLRRDREQDQSIER
ncbi:relaxase domain-containing protein [Solirubrobacter ginsenosidimutans]|uniref:Relaxase domain-containing protein n=1 Tax=Solirubrobacter ginsenosidimutans TaxID=490573 RepID=A0A9X3S550_9ACTN|nr:relaxase domain-containing protein [Solirubrobacter ginsenosidimutans]